jgi:hypothetical protein
MQDAPEVSLVVSHAALVLDQIAHPRRSPQPGAEAERFGVALERVLDVLASAGAKC